MTRTIPLLPDSQDITAHLQWLFGGTEGAHEGALIEIAFDELGKGSPSRARLFCVPELSEAVSFATETNRRGCNVWVGATLKKSGTPRGKRTKADNFLVAFALPIDIDENAASVNAKLDQIAVAGLTVTTGTIPELRQQKWFRLAQPCADPAPYEAAIKRIVEHVGADASATGAARLMRLGGTVSYPPARKQQRGYVNELTKVHIIADAPAVHVETFLDKPGTIGGGLIDAPTRPQTNRPAVNGNTFAEIVANSQLADIVRAIPNDDAPYKIWCDIGMTIHHETKASAEGYALWVEWSARSAKHDLTDMPKKWRSFGGCLTPLTIGTLRYYANQCRLEEPDPSRKDGDEPSDTAEDIDTDDADEASLENDEDWNSSDIDINRLRLSSRIITLIRTGEDTKNAAIEPHSAFFTVCIAMVSAKCSDTTIEAVLLNPQYAISAYALGQKYSSAFVKKQIKVAREKAKNRKEKTIEEKILEAVKAMNLRHAWSVDGGRGFVMRFLAGGEFERLTVEAFEQAHDTKKFPVWNGREFRDIGIGSIWMDHPHRRAYIEGIVFRPNGDAPPGAYNTWTGFTVPPCAGSWVMLRSHIRDIICAGNLQHYEYLLNWCARLFQRPGEQGRVAVVLRSGEGTGKGIFARALLEIVGRHGRHISQSKHLVGAFNQHLRDCILLFADEAFFAGDKAHIGALKTLITESKLSIEAKFQNVVETSNFIHLIMASNESWVVPAGADARRFFVLEVSDDRVGDTAYFDSIVKEMESGGYAAMLHDFLSRDISAFKVTEIPASEALNAQKRESLNTEQRWWMNCLSRGYVLRSKLGLEAELHQWLETASTELLYESYETFAKTTHERHPLNRVAFGKFLKEVGASSTRLRDAIVGERMVHHPGEHYSETYNAPRPTGYYLGDIAHARSGFEELLGHLIEWPDAEGASAAKTLFEDFL